MIHSNTVFVSFSTQLASYAFNMKLQLTNRANVIIHFYTELILR